MTRTARSRTVAAAVVAALFTLGTAPLGFTTPFSGSGSWPQSPVAHHGVIEEVFLRAMSRFYGPEWHRWMPESVVAEHWRRFPTHFGSGVEAAFAAWMQVHFGAGWQQWVPAHVVYQCWSDFTNLRSR
ncbi:MAG: hypothetical protein KF724_12865 [Phycisphaeraceae bacterium]|nr:hypothetical protein [Phycisphaeraceae bacterium]